MHEPTTSAQNTTTNQNTGPAEAELRPAGRDPKGVLPKHLKPWLYVGVACLVVLAAVFSGTGKKTASGKKAASEEASAPLLVDDTAANAQALKSDTAAAEQAAAEQGANTAPAETPAQQAAAAAYGPNGEPVPCGPGQNCAQAPGGYAEEQLSPSEQEAEQLAARDRELSYESRFASNIAYAREPDRPAKNTDAIGSQSSAASLPAGQNPSSSSLITPHTTLDPPAASAAQRNPEVNIDSAAGKPYVLYEGTTLDTVLMNRLDGDALGPVKVLVSNPVYSHGRQHVLIPAGTVVLGEARAIGSPEIGHRRRMALIFHRMIMPDGYSVDLDQFQGLDQSGAVGIKGKVNNHHLQIFGTSIALGVVAGAGEIEEGGGMISTNGRQAFVTGASGSVSQSATTVLDRFLNIPPTITIREGHRIKVYFTQDLLLPAYDGHTVLQDF